MTRDNTELAEEVYNKLYPEEQKTQKIQKVKAALEKGWGKLEQMTSGGFSKYPQPFRAIAQGIFSLVAGAFILTDVAIVLALLLVGIAQGLPFVLTFQLFSGGRWSSTYLELLGNRGLKPGNYFLSFVISMGDALTSWPKNPLMFGLHLLIFKPLQLAVTPVFLAFGLAMDVIATVGLLPLLIVGLGVALAALTIVAVSIAVPLLTYFALKIPLYIGEALASLCCCSRRKGSGQEELSVTIPEAHGSNVAVALDQGAQAIKQGAPKPGFDSEDLETAAGHSRLTSSAPESDVQRKSPTRFLGCFHRTAKPTKSEESASAYVPTDVGSRSII